MKELDGAIIWYKFNCLKNKIYLLGKEDPKKQFLSVYS